jgi:hypothetical protein
MDTREMLELAARAISLDLAEWTGPDDQLFPNSFWAPALTSYWNPLVPGADAMRLATRLGLSIEPYPFYEPVKHSVIVRQRRRGDQLRESNPTEVVELYGDNPDAATCLAIVKCAAKIGEAMK